MSVVRGVCRSGVAAFAGAAIALGLCGCGSGPEPTSISSAAPSAGSPASFVIAATGEYAQTATIVTEQEGVTIDTSGRYDADDGRWTAQMNIAYTGSHADEVQGMNLIVTPDDAYLSMDGWDVPLRGRWLPVISTGAPGTDFTSGTAPAGLPPAVSALEDFEGTCSADVCTGTIPASTGIYLVGLGKALNAMAASQTEIDAMVRMPATVLVDAQNRPLSLQVEGSGVQIADTSLLSTELVTLLRAASAKATYSAWGTDVSIQVPEGGQLIDPSEMNP